MDMSLFSSKGAVPAGFDFDQQLSDDRVVIVSMQGGNNGYPSPATHSTSDSGEFPLAEGGGGRWAAGLLRECARAISDKDSSKSHQLLWMLNELASPYGDCEQKLASYFLQALFCKATDSGRRCYRTLASVAEKSHSFDAARRLILKFQEVSPWTTFGHVASNGAILEALESETKLHIIDISNTFCTQWPTLLEALATRNDETPRLKLTVIMTATTAARSSVMKEIGQRMEKFARLMGVPFEINVMGEPVRLGELTRERLGILDDEAVAVNCVGALRRVVVEERAAVIAAFRMLLPKVVTVVEEEADFSSPSGDFVKCFEECLRFYTVYFEMLEESFMSTSNERLMLEKECSRSIVRVLASDPAGDHGDGDGDIGGNSIIGWESERRERGSQWSERLRQGFSPVRYSDDVIDDVKALIKRYRTGWSLVLPQAGQLEMGIHLAWKEEPVVWASAWKP
ncbi:hypothetical protein SAY87_021253 [Trapa incisa]|uniref:Uncharacterized protein n=1 Tax=Trapa incisa TaxID=236973 RepID=A0AAN7JT28_9MYRT|nr:hypothetical protein SAY87_021253 [Trapa incisa]